MVVGRVPKWSSRRSAGLKAVRNPPSAYDSFANRPPVRDRLRAFKEEKVGNSSLLKNG